MKSNIIKSLLVISLLSVGLSSCDRFFDITPTGKVIPESLSDFRALLTRAYEVYPQHTAWAGLKSDELKANAATEDLQALFTWNEANALPGSVEMPYASFYQTIFFCNYILENATKTVSPSAEPHQVLGEAYALRAYAYFQLVNLYAPAYSGNNGAAAAVPLITSVRLEGDFPRASLDEVYSQILSDIHSAEALIHQKSFSVGYNYRFTTTALHAFKARVFQYRNDWQNALNEAEKALALNSSLEDFNHFTVLPSSFQSTESIMNLDMNMNSRTNNFSRASDEHIALFDQVNDLRFAKYFVKNGANWQTTKYNSNNSLKCSFRVGEIVLIKAEAQAKLGDEAASKATLLDLATKRYNSTGLSNFSAKINALSGANYYTELLNERARETSFEGLRWFDLRRTTQPEIIHTFDGKEYKLNSKDPRYTLPFPQDARLKNPAL